LNMH